MRIRAAQRRVGALVVGVTIMAISAAALPAEAGAVAPLRIAAAHAGLNAIARPALPGRQSVPRPATVSTGTWTSVASMLGYHENGRLARLKDGRVLIVGSNTSVVPEVYDPATDTWTATPAVPVSPSIPTPVLVTLADGNVMLVGTSGLIFDVASWTWKSITGAAGNAPLLLRDGRVLVWGPNAAGVQPDVCRYDAEVYDPTTDTTQYISSASIGICLNEAHLTQVADGRVLLHGGCPRQANDSEPGLGGMYWIDPTSLTMAIAALDGGTVAGTCSGSVTLPDGEELYVGGQTYGSFPYPAVWLPDVARFDPLHQTTIPVHALPQPLTAARGVVLAGGTVLVVAGASNVGLIATTYAYDLSTDRWTTLAPWPGSYLRAATVLDDGSVLAIEDGTAVWRLVLPGAESASDATGATYHPLAPTRLLDTRFGAGLTGTFKNAVPRTFQVTGVGGVPLGAVAVTGNLTATRQTSAGYVGLGPVPTAAPSTSSLNFPLRDNRGNGVTVSLGPTGSLSATFRGLASASTDLIFDVTGYFVPDATGATYHALTPARLLDTRFGTGLTGTFKNAIPRTFQVTGVAGVPVSATAVTGNLTATRQTSGGYVGLGPVATSAPTTSSLNFPLGDNRGNGVTVSLSVTGSLSATFKGLMGAATDLIFDVTGYFVPDGTGATYHPLTPTRLLDSRLRYDLPAALRSAHAGTFQVGGPAVPLDATAVTGNLTVTGQTAAGWLALTLTPIDNPSTATLNVPLGDTRGNGIAIGLGPNGTLGITYRGATNSTAHVIFDVTGYFAT